ncbi:type II secretion system protein GspK, partial [Klebsiella aerogenes]|uniref:type II secretion system protein GspK n=2 Tax=Pseudomonadota TaxID=1224 RepID=UPI0013D5E4E3
LTDSLLSWQDGFSRDHNATLLDYAADDVRPRGALFVTVGELAAVKGMTPALLDRLAPVLTVFPGNGAFMPQ